MLKGMVLGIALMLAVALACAYALVQSGFIPANADAKSGRLETWMAHTSLDATLRRDAPHEQNQVALTDQNLMEGVHLFAQNCVVCHGSAKGEAARSPIAKGELSAASAIGDRWGGGRPGRLFVLEDQAWHTADRYAIVRLHAK